jgi:hypothetical protein
METAFLEKMHALAELVLRPFEPHQVAGSGERGRYAHERVCEHLRNNKDEKASYPVSQS